MALRACTCIAKRFSPTAKPPPLPHPSWFILFPQRWPRVAIPGKRLDRLAVPLHVSPVLGKKKKKGLEKLQVFSRGMALGGICVFVNVSDKRSRGVRRIEPLLHLAGRVASFQKRIRTMAVWYLCGPVAISDAAHVSWGDTVRLADMHHYYGGRCHGGARGSNTK